MFNFQESVTSPAAQQGADGDKAGDQRRLDRDTTATAQNFEKGNAAHSKETGVLLGVTYSRDTGQLPFLELEPRCIHGTIGVGRVG